MGDATGKTFDDFGALTAPLDEGRASYDLRKLIEYCEGRGIDPSELTDDELKPFERN